MPEFTIVHVVPDLRRQAGGIAAVVPALASALRTQGIESRFVTYKHDLDFAFAEQTTCRPPSDAWYPGKLTEVIEGVLADLPATAPALLHCHGIWDLLNHAGIRAARRMGRPAVTSLHGMLLPWARQHKHLRKDIAWSMYQRRDLLCASRLHVTSPAERQIVAEIAGSDAVVEIPFGVDLPAFAPLVEGTTKTLLFVGRLHPVKNLEILIRAFSEVAPDSWALRLIGPDEEGHRAKLEALVASLGVDQIVSLPGPAYGIEKERELAAAMALVLPSFTENFGSVVAEALAMGRPVITTHGTPWQMLEDAGCGWCVAPDQDGLTRAIDELCRMPTQVLADMGSRGRDLVTHNFSWERIGRRMAQFYAGLAAIHGNRPSIPLETIC